MYSSATCSKTLKRLYTEDKLATLELSNDDKLVIDKWLFIVPE